MLPLWGLGFHLEWSAGKLPSPEEADTNAMWPLWYEPLTSLFGAKCARTLMNLDLTVKLQGEGNARETQKLRP